jgi:hypothetical protein
MRTDLFCLGSLLFLSMLCSQVMLNGQIRTFLRAKKYLGQDKQDWRLFPSLLESIWSLYMWSLTSLNFLIDGLLLTIVTWSMIAMRMTHSALRPLLLVLLLMTGNKLSQAMEITSLLELFNAIVTSLKLTELQWRTPMRAMSMTSMCQGKCAMTTSFRQLF